MPKVRTLSAHSRASSYSSSSMTMEKYKVEEQLGSAADVKEWEEARCPICMEHPHNAVLLKCSSYKKGCRPYMCDTSYRHSYCLDRFCESFAPHASNALLQENPLTSSAFRSRREDGSEPGQARYCGSQLQPKLFCPLCRGEVYGCSIVEPAREFMNSKARSCSSEMCDFCGTYSELRKHARSEHPSESMPRLRQTTRGTHGNTGYATIPSNFYVRVPRRRWSWEETIIILEMSIIGLGLLLLQVCLLL
ncbi:uncharacterized protein LOC132168749 [Corylus avellana]|uniref:uncharacterized protein LOC132168749 n=1 Tax=Corylus avellana TaxID=13451 RepID=UPI001E202039|nr:uncharacterized protein LOC132168749 [Corylus avellana]XP_059435764.1 uncharacterized protein LOC132168749 [Corylus avellana]XP_059435765.1 uncharacterized protein LOC132168749 [Corylus avellana]XP_059435766.1 uncharacterized protein LOC132168749 [Corylus avellana]